MKREAFLEFVELDDYIAHVREHTPDGEPLNTNVEYANQNGKADRFQIFAVTFMVVLTKNLGDHIACHAQTILLTSSFDLDCDRDRPLEQQSRTKLHANFDKYCAMLRDEKHLVLTRGKWTLDAPEYLR